MKINDFTALLKQRVLVLDGAMGTMLQRYSLKEADFRGARFSSHQTRLSGCNDILCLTRPEVVKEIHKAYLDAGADIISTDTFNANAISMADYALDGIPGLVREINKVGASLAKEVSPASPVRGGGGSACVAGSMGPS
ncbi:MAG: homocysteine S-methyltransferase family protein, partial [Muribaculaceae bacterium]|nr:homocysteine S-methyltransferase family protein [Muribaculaceae bacterium]